MPLASGRRLNTYEILSPLGKGGMGEVYLARDEKLRREVAIKVLPEAFTSDPERLTRFEREARLLASLNHPNIAGIYGLEESNGIRFLVLEFVPGETLAERLAHGALDIEDSLKICRQIAEALEAAHEKGIIHRDLKPANIKVTPDDKVKVLDFGLAKAFAAEESSPGASLSPTLTVASLREGVIMGTAAYMSPEQARGKPLDKRTDIWSFGCVLYECLTSVRAFSGETVTDIMAAIVHNTPNWEALPGVTPANIRTLLRRCVHKDRSLRLHDIADARIEIDEALHNPSAPSATVLYLGKQRRQPLTWVLFGCLLGLLIGALAAGLFWWTRTEPTMPSVARLSVNVPDGERLSFSIQASIALSPDGSHVVYVTDRSGATRLYLRRLDQFEATLLPGTAGAVQPFFSPDGQWVGFFADGKMKKVAITGGAPLDICDTPTLSRGATWGPDGTIFFTPQPNRGLSRVSASGGTPQIVTTPDTSKGQFSHRWPELLPGGEAVLFSMGRSIGSDWDAAQIAMLSLKTGKLRILVEGGSNARYVRTGHLVFARAASLLAVPFDLERLEVTGPPIPVLDGVATSSTSGAAQFALSRNGSLAYIPGGAEGVERTLVLVDRRGQSRPLLELRRGFVLPRFSPDDRRVAVSIEGANMDIWIHEIQRPASLTRFTFDPGTDGFAVWSPDSARIAFTSFRTGQAGLFSKASDGSGNEEMLLSGGDRQFPSSWSQDGQLLAYHETSSQTSGDIWILPMKGDRKPRVFLNTPSDERCPVFSPDGKWLAYSSNATGRKEIYVQPYPGPGGKWQISSEGGEQPLWARNGRELFYRNGDKVMIVAVSTQPTFHSSTPTLLFEGQYSRAFAGNFTDYDISPDGRHFVMSKEPEQKGPATRVNVVLNWFEDLKRRVPD
ncbi:MAG: protein kinase domain-containing protein [Acidobacteriota bacterium]